VRRSQVTAIQAARAPFPADPGAYETLRSLAEFAVVVALLGGVLDRERRRVARWQRRKHS
jgi:hypothetical protein